MTRVLLHPGLHKTGTKSVQQFLWANGPIIWPRAALILPARITAITQLVFTYARNPAPEILAALGAETRTFLSGLSLDRHNQPPRDIIISAENLIGPMPSGNAAPYPSAAAILTEITAALRDTVAAAEVTIHLSTRAPMDWARSLHAHHARRLTGLRQTGSADDLAAGLARWPLAALTDMTIPGATVTATDMATLAGQPFGIAQPFVDFLRLPPHLIARLSPVPHLHRSDPTITDRMMALNRSDLNDDALEQAKRAILNRPAKASA